MKIETRDFGEINIDEQNILKFQQPIYGFEHLSHFVLLGDDEMGPNIAWLQSTEDSGICFILFNPIIVDKDYAAKVTAEVSHKLNEMGMHKVDYWVIAVVPEAFQNTVVNLKSPVLIDMDSKLAAQIILESDYPISAPLISNVKGDK